MGDTYASPKTITESTKDLQEWLINVKAIDRALTNKLEFLKKKKEEYKNDDVPF
ncbi:MAG: hypothetical protein ACXADS_15420 [Candidatus Thorarchaeota archaeon]|jgi:hypothetical protein